MPISPMNRAIQHLSRVVLAQEKSALTDGQLLESFLAQRDEAAIAALVRRHGPMIYGVCRRMLRNHHDAEDAFQATFLVLVRKAASIVPREMVANWLYGVACQTALKARATIAKRTTRERQMNAIPESAARPEVRQSDLEALLDRELRRLPNKYRVPIVLCDLQGKSRREAAAQLKIAEGTLSSRLTTAHEMLAKRMTRRGMALSTLLLVETLAASTASASVPASLTSTTVKAASVFAAGTTAAGSISAPVAALTEGVLRAMLLTKLKIATAIVLTITVLGVGVGGSGLESYLGASGGETQTIGTARSAQAGEQDVEEWLYAILRKDGCIRHPKLDYEIFVKSVKGRKLYDVQFMRRAADGPGFDVIARAKEAELRYSPVRKKILVDMRECHIQQRDGAVGYVESRIWEIDIPDDLIVAASGKRDAQFVRRVYLDIRGNLPSPAEIQDYLQDKNPDRHERLIKRLEAKNKIDDALTGLPDDGSKRKVLEEMVQELKRVPHKAADPVPAGSTWKGTIRLEERPDGDDPNSVEEARYTDVRIAITYRKDKIVKGEFWIDDGKRGAQFVGKIEDAKIALTLTKTIKGAWALDVVGSRTISGEVRAGKITGIYDEKRRDKSRLLGSLEATLRKTDPDDRKFPRSPNPRERAIEVRLEQPISLNFKNLPLREAIRTIAVESGVQVVPDHIRMGAAGIALDAPVSVSVNDISMKSALQMLLRPLRLTFVVDNEVLIITTEPVGTSDKTHDVKLRDMPWPKVFDWYSELSGLPFSAKSLPRGKVTFIPPKGKEKYTLGEITDILNDLLAAQDYLLIRGDTSFTVVPTNANFDPTFVPSIRLQDLDKRGKTELVLLTLPLKKLNAADFVAEVAKMLGPLGVVVVEPISNTLLLRATVGRLRQIHETLQARESAEAKKR